jgi:hypothetical protein
VRLEDFLSLLDCVQQQASGDYKARCPAHHDRTPSLSVAERDGKIILHCFANCFPEDVVRSLGIKMSDLQGKREPVAVYPYVDEEGNLLYEKLRFEPKDFLQRQASGEYGLNGTRRVLYRLPEVLAARAAGRMIYLTEGEKDADTIRCRGFVATTSTEGSGGWRPEYSESLRGARIAVVVDRDDPGTKHARVVQKKLEGIANELHFIQARTGKDAHDHFEAGYGVDDFVPYRFSQDGAVSSSELVETALAELDPSSEDRVYYGSPWPSTGLEFVPGRLYVVGGHTAHGKSAFAIQVFRHQAEHGVRIGMFTNEMNVRDIRNRMICSMTGLPLVVVERPSQMDPAQRASYVDAVERFRPWSIGVHFDTGADAEAVEKTVSEEKYEFVIFDHLHRTGKDDESAIAKEVRGFTNIALNHDIPVLLVSQLRRPFEMKRPGKHDFKGSGAIEQEAAMAMSVWQDDHGRAYLDILKNRHGAIRSNVLYFDGPRFMFTEKAPQQDVQKGEWWES